MLNGSKNACKSNNNYENTVCEIGEFLYTFLFSIQILIFLNIKTRSFKFRIIETYELMEINFFLTENNFNFG